MAGKSDLPDTEEMADTPDTHRKGGTGTMNEREFEAKKIAAAAKQFGENAAAGRDPAAKAARNTAGEDAEIFTMTEPKAPGASGKKKGSGGLLAALRALFQK